VRSVSRQLQRASLLAVCGLLLAAALAGCTTTQETAARKQAQSKRILERREHKRNHDKTERARNEKK
jgi:outer membrane protein assembly factor BamE (lipoprotein component of BamABCDE complex)